MANSTAVSVAAISVVVLAFFLTGLYFWCRRRRHRRPLIQLQTAQNSGHKSDSDAKRRITNIHPHGVSQKTLFNWDDNPSLVNDAVENGWTQFAFTADTSSSPSPTTPRFLGLRAAGEIPTAEISWEVSQGSADFMQKIRLNTASVSSPVFSVIKTALPLPGPPLASFPQEAYFEITILNISGNGIEPIRGGKEGEKIKLIPQNYSSESLAYFTSSNKVSNVEELKVDGKGEGDEVVEDLMLSVGLTAAGAAPFKLPGSYPGSIGFNSNGSVYLDGMKLVYESEKEEWGRWSEKVIGCGFDPKQKKVFFTVDAELVHVINCKSDEYGRPLYPCVGVGGRVEVEVMVNLGQSMFKYIPAQRTPNPCFVNGCQYEDSRELFSMGIIDSQWFNPATTPKHTINNNNNNNNNVVVHHQLEDDEFFDEIELFEIVVDHHNPHHHLTSIH